MTDDLPDYADLTAKLATITADDDLLITPADLPAGLPDHLRFDGLVTDTSFIRGIDWVGDADKPFKISDRSLGFNAFALPDGYRRFGLWLLQLLFSGREWAGLKLTHPKSRSRYFYAHVLRPEKELYGLQIATPETWSGYLHNPQEVWRHPFADHDMTPVQRLTREEDRPFFAFGWSDDQQRQQWDIPHADQLIFQATPAGIAAMAGLMFDMAHPTFGRDEINMEPPIIGFAATQPRSIEARFWLPGSLCFPEDSLDDLWMPPFR